MAYPSTLPYNIRKCFDDEGFRGFQIISDILSIQDKVNESLSYQITFNIRDQLLVICN
jgi:hypothetical protein